MNDSVTQPLSELPDQIRQSDLLGNNATNRFAESHSDETEENDDHNLHRVTLIAKFGKERITLENLSEETTIGTVKFLLQERTRVLPKRQKLLGLVAQIDGAKGVHDDLPLSLLKTKGSNSSSKAISTDMKQQQATHVTHQFILMGTPEELIFVDPSDLEMEDLPDVVDDFDLEFNAGSEQWLQHVANGENLKKFTEKTEVHIMNEPRQGKPLLVLDLDHTLLDFSSRTLMRQQSAPAGAGSMVDHLPGQGAAAIMKRPYMDQFLTQCYQHFDLVVWSQTSWRWLETKLIELGMINSRYKFCFVLDKTSMFTITGTHPRTGALVEHHVKPLQIIWSKFPQAWGSHNTIHIDDLARNFALNMPSGLRIKAFFRKKSSAARDTELLLLGRYLEMLASSGLDFNLVDFSQWPDVVAGNSPLISDSANSQAKK